ncbi:hypothetical protein BH18ACI3_BH18ACI3_19230 [soil metagenome]
MLNLMTYSLPEELNQAFLAETKKLIKENIISRIWARDSSVWTNDDEAQWLGWLDIVAEELNDLQKYRDLRQDIDAAKFNNILLMGMGGSSLCPEVLAITFGVDNFHILDSTVPAQIKAVESKLDPAKTLFIVASKSGSTLEPNCFKQYFFDRVSQEVSANQAGKQFIAITDPDSKMEHAARKDGFRHIVHGKPEIGGRFSALSAFGMAPASIMGLDVERFLESAREMVEACKNENPQENPGAILGTILGICHRNGRDKLTIFTSPEIYDLGAWLEQLIAESTGKNGVSIIPVDSEPILPAEHYGEDRVFAYLKLKSSPNDEQIGAIRVAGHPFISIEIDDNYDLGQEFFRWEFATAVAGSIMGINPFNQPDVESAKIEARKITDEYEQTGELPEEEPFYEENGIKLFTNEDNTALLAQYVGEEKSLAKYLEAHLARLEENDYFALLAYVEMSAENEEILQAIREKVLETKLVATCLGFGPRFLHSTGQAYKGGGNNGVFLQITSDDEFDLPVPGHKYSFGVVKTAQARGDFQVLLDRERRALRVHLGSDVKSGLDKLLNQI